MKKLIIIRGPSAVGKTSVVKKLIQKLTGKVAYIPVAHTTYSLIPEDIAFASNKLIDLMHDNADDLIRNFLNANYTVISDAIFSHSTKGQSRLDNLVQIGKTNGAKVYVFELCADISTLKNRAKKRKRSKDETTNYDLIDKKYSKFLKTKYEGAINIDTNKKTLNQIADEIMTYF